MIRIDLHTHSSASPDGSLTLADYKRMLETNKLEVIAITDHNTIDFAQKAQQALGEQIIVGEEITTTEGEIIGLYLTKRIEPGLSAHETAQEIKKQHGAVYIPHPFETVRKGISLETLDEIAELVDIIEVHNGRAVFQNRGQQARIWAQKHQVAMATSSDAHGRVGWGRTYSQVAEVPTNKTLAQTLSRPETQLHTKTVGLRGLAYPKLNKLRKRA